MHGLPWTQATFFLKISYVSSWSLSLILSCTVLYLICYFNFTIDILTEGLEFFHNPVHYVHLKTHHARLYPSFASVLSYLLNSFLNKSLSLLSSKISRHQCLFPFCFSLRLCCIFICTISSLLYTFRTLAVMFHSSVICSASSSFCYAVFCCNINSNSNTIGSLLPLKWCCNSHSYFIFPHRHS